MEQQVEKPLLICQNLHKKKNQTELRYNFALYAPVIFNTFQEKKYFHPSKMHTTFTLLVTLKGVSHPDVKFTHRHSLTVFLRVL